ncbi:hypothetical protein RhiirA5_433522 [Rhizophagus irregularis]|uniref:Uncharacterized protein n=1 Tax=Rhizophagus irregularis TaxID=588596 RepID=A0A2N0NRK7_9GLOM|nr:hypothetical protein RhiirA5_433522 [Rhizophagus irregularis]
MEFGSKYGFYVFDQMQFGSFGFDRIITLIWILVVIWITDKLTDQITQMMDNNRSDFSDDR